MRISFVDIQNFRKLKSIRIAFSDTTTIFVGANNSGKTSAMLALGHFLINHQRFNTNDFTLSNWYLINKIGSELEKEKDKQDNKLVSIEGWETALPALDIWLEVAKNEIHLVRQILPTLDWAGGRLGVRLRYEPKILEDLYKDYLNARKDATQAKREWAKKGTDKEQPNLALWPSDLRSFLDRRMSGHFAIRSYLLDPAKSDFAIGANPKPQPIPADSEGIDGNILKGLVRIDEIAAQRGLGGSGIPDDIDGIENGEPSRGSRKLSEQLRSYYSKHLDPSDSPESEDLDALEAIETSQKAFDDRLASGFSSALKELESLNYPGVTDPKLKIATRIRPTEGLNHSGAVQFEVIPVDGKEVLVPLRLPEEYNGLGYQNLISMVFKLMSFRDAWMKVGKAGKIKDVATQTSIPPLHLVLVEEPEAHLHAQVQQVFVKKAYEVLRNHDDLKDKQTLQTQLIVSTHSSHVAHESKFSWLRYFRRLPANANCNVPTSVVVNLSQVFGPDDETEKFVTRYLRSTHCDLFFADAAILVEGPAERILVPHFIRKNFQELNRCFVTLLEIGGRHAYRLRPLIEALGLTTLIITDLDSSEGGGYHKAVAPKRGEKQISTNYTLKSWHPEKDSLDELLDMDLASKVKQYENPRFAIRVAFQTPMTLKFKEKVETALATTFEDALVFENLPLFQRTTVDDLVRKFKEAIEQAPDAAALGQSMFELLRKADKASFALELLISESEEVEPGTKSKELDAPLEQLRVPSYIKEGLRWLESQLVKKKEEILASATIAASEAAAK